MSFTRVKAHDPSGEFWQGYRWSSWEVLADARPPKVPGIYRIMANRHRNLLYIGISSNLATRVSTLRRGVMTGRAVTHPAAPCVGSYGPSNIRISWVEIKTDELSGDHEGRRELYGIEAELIASYRAALHESPLCQWSGEPQP
jgi:hypothetical protein